MEVHHHSNPSSHKNKNWKHYFWEFFMLFLAVFCGFLAENQREHILEKRRAKDYAQTLVSDLRSDLRILEIIKNQMHHSITTIDSLAAYVNSHELNQMRNIDLFLLGSLDRYRPYKWNRATIQQLISSGSLRYYADPTLINAISTYMAYTYHLDEDFKGDEERSNSAGIKRDEVIDMSYPPDLLFGLRNNRDSVLQTESFKKIYATDRKTLLTHDIRDVHVFVNNKLNIRRNQYIRCEEELPELIAEAKTIIAMINKKYHWD
jgi:hypothetical protein